MNEPGENREEDPEEMEEGMEGEYPEEMGNPEDMEEPIEGEEGQEEPIEGEMEDPEMGAPKDEDTDEDDEDEFPPYANEENKKLDQIIKEKKKMIGEYKIKIDDSKERVGILNEHHKNVHEELQQNEKLVDAKNKEIETEDHMKQMAEREAGRIMADAKKLDTRSGDEQERLNNIQNMIFKANEKMDQFKLEMNWNQEELEQWALAARQKEEDNLTLEKYRRADEAKIKELTLQVQRKTIQVGRKQNELEKEVTDTKAAQIELDKTAEEFKRLHNERHELYLQWEETLKTIKRREEQIEEEGDRLAKAEIDLENKQTQVSQNKKQLDSQKASNKQKEGKNHMKSRLLVNQRMLEAKKATDLENLHENVKITSNQLSAFATEQGNKRTHVAELNKDLERAKKRLDASRKKYTGKQKELNRETTAEKSLFDANKEAEKHYKESKGALSEVQKQINTLTGQNVIYARELLKLREKQADLIGEISGALSARKNLEAKLKRIAVEKERQEEMLYDTDYKIQQMEQKVARAQGQRPKEEADKKQEEIKALEKILEKKEEEWKMLNDAVKKLEDDIRGIVRKNNKTKEAKTTLQVTIDELKLENDMALLEFDKLVKKKEGVLLSHDIMKLENKKLTNTVNGKADQLFGLENRKYQLQMSMEEREKEIMVHKEILTSELKSAEEERHKVAVELQVRKNKVKNLKIKYEGLISRNKATREDDTEGEHSQAYYVIKAAQEKEELQRYGDELDGKIKKCEKELKALKNTLDHLKKRNLKYREKLTEGMTKGDVEKKEVLEEQCRAASETLFKKRKELQRVQKEYEEDMKRIMEIQTEIENMNKQKEGYAGTLDKIDKDLISQDQKYKRAQKTMTLNQEKAMKAGFDTQSAAGIDIQLEIEKLRNATMLNALSVLVAEIPEMAQFLEDPLSQHGIKIPSRPSSAVQRPWSSSSGRSVSSHHSEQV